MSALECESETAADQELLEHQQRNTNIRDNLTLFDFCFIIATSQQYLALFMFFNSPRSLLST